jgi:thymidylate synthase
MRIYNSAMEMVREVERDLFEMGIRVHPETMQDKNVKDNPDFETVELQAYDYKLTSWKDINEMVKYMKGNLDWAAIELQDRLSETYANPGRAYKFNEMLWAQFLRDGTFSYTYNERLRGQLPIIVEELKKRPNSRQAIVTMYDWHQDLNNLGGRDRVPCSMYYQFYIRGGKLNLIYTMRSCDFLVHFVHDVWLAIWMLSRVSMMIDIEPGIFTHFIGSLHAYKKDMDVRGIF